MRIAIFEVLAMVLESITLFDAPWRRYMRYPELFTSLWSIRLSDDPLFTLIPTLAHFYNK